MRLIARVATLRFVRRRRPDGRDSAGRWLSLALRWRRARRLRVRSERRAHSVSARTTWQPQLHWHLELRTGGRAERMTATTRYLASVRESKRVATVYEHRWHQPPAAIAAPGRRASAARRDWRRSGSINARPTRATSTPIRIERPAPGWQPGRQGHAVRLDARTHSLTRIRSVERMLSTENLIRHHDERSIRGQVRQAATSQDPLRVNARTNPPFRPIEIAWRTSRSVAPNPDHPIHQRSFDALLRSPQHHSPPPAMTASGSPTEPARPAVLQIADLDASVVDRLTDDVVRRVERRVRIERERRGM